MTGLDRLFLAVLFVAVVIIVDQWTARRRKYKAMMAAHCACIELARMHMDHGRNEMAEAFILQLVNVEKGLGIRE